MGSGGRSGSPAIVGAVHPKGLPFVLTQPDEIEHFWDWSTLIRQEKPTIIL
jgi:hypothetical protein